MKTIMERDRAYIANTYARFPLGIVRGEGARLFDADGKEYIDMQSGIAVNTFGIADSSWVEAVTSQLKTLSHTSNLYYSDPCVDLAELLCEKTGMKKVFFSNSGAEANECAIKTARKYAAEKKGAEYSTIITLKNSFHGRTITTLAATGQDVFHQDFQPLTPGFVYASAEDPEEVSRLAKEYPCAAIFFELVQGEGGVFPLSCEYVSALCDIARREDLLLMVDEVQTGNGRTGKLYAYMHYGFMPDIITTAKGLGGGLPIGATLLGDKVENTLGVGMHGSTFGGNPVCCAGALNILSRLDESFLKSVEEKSDYLMGRLRNAEGVKSVSGLGLMIGIETERDSTEVIADCMKNGVLVIKAKSKVRLLPPLNIPFDLLEKATDRILEACKKA